VRSIARDQRGVASLEYAALLGFVLLAVAAAVTAIGRDVSDTTQSMSQNLGGMTGVVYVESPSD